MHKVQAIIAESNDKYTNVTIVYVTSILTHRNCRHDCAVIQLLHSPVALPALVTTSTLKAKSWGVPASKVMMATLSTPSTTE